MPNFDCFESPKLIDITLHEAQVTYPLIPARTLQSVYTFVEHNQTPGSFLAAVLSNDLVDAVNRADIGCMIGLKDLVTFLNMHVPDDCWGSFDKARNWKPK